MIAAATLFGVAGGLFAGYAIGVFWTRYVTSEERKAELRELNEQHHADVAMLWEQHVIEMEGLRDQLTQHRDKHGRYCK